MPHNVILTCFIPKLTSDISCFLLWRKYRQKFVRTIWRNNKKVYRWESNRRRRLSYYVGNIVLNLQGRCDEITKKSAFGCIIAEGDFFIEFILCKKKERGFFAAPFLNSASIDPFSPYRHVSGFALSRGNQTIFFAASFCNRWREREFSTSQYHWGVIVIIFI